MGRSKRRLMLSFEVMLKRCFLLLSLGLVLHLQVPPLPACANNDHGLQPKSLYHRVWQLVQENYVDPTFNDQKWSKWEHRYDSDIKTNEDARKAIETMLISLGDRYSRYLDPAAFADEKEQIESHLFGIGIQMGLDKTHKLVVIAPIEGTPAARAGLMPLDEITEVDGKATQGLSVEEVSKFIRGPIGSTVKMVVTRDKERRTFVMVRDEIPLHSVQTAKMLTDDIGYIRLSTFMSQRANQEMREALDKLGPARGLIIDLRNNPGGLVTNALDVCNMFLDGGIIVSTVDRTGSFQSARAAGTPITRQPMVVLINHGSASASEITSGALHDGRRAELVGQKSFGKGLVQSITRLEDGSGLNLTIAKYLTPNNIDIHKKGIVPDYEVDLKPEDYEAGRGPWWLDPSGPSVHRAPEDLKDVQLKKAVEVLKDKLATPAASFTLKLNSFPNAVPPGVGIGAEP